MSSKMNRKEFKVGNVFRKKISGKVIGEAVISRYITDDNQNLVLEICLNSKFTIEKSYPNTLFGKEDLEDFEKQFKTELDVQIYLGVPSGT
jgi:hypothetical protein